jgi:putative ABC transport system permease protein
VAADPAALRDAFRRALKEVDPDVPVAAVATMAQAIDSAMAPRRLNLWLVRTFAALALLLSSAGVYAVTAFSVALRRRELAIRTALGAGQARNLTTILADTVRPLLRGLVIGAVGSLIAAPALRSVLFEVDPLAIVTFSAVGATLFAAGAAAALAAAWPIRRIHPAETLQMEAR